MPLSLETILVQLVPLLAGSVGTGFAWTIKSLLSAKKDLDSAHCKLRSLELRIEEMEKFLQEGK